uniref:Putative hat transposable element n=1 Tax=Ixodes ricinus TaxID=34613 RepID=A0A147BD68_IXORI
MSWNFGKRKTRRPELFSLAPVALAVPATQVSVERSISGLKYILSCQRKRLSPDVLDDVLFLRLFHTAKAEHTLSVKLIWRVHVTIVERYSIILAVNIFILCLVNKRLVPSPMLHLEFLNIILIDRWSGSTQNQ